MPDTHRGATVPIGFVAKVSEDRGVIPEVASSDIGCGMTVYEIGKLLKDIDWKAFYEYINENIPSGTKLHEKGHSYDFSKMRMPLDKNIVSKYYRSLGTLGGGNHFIELCIDENDDVWVMLHSGSRGLGNVIGTYFIERAKKEAQSRFGHVPDKDLSYFAEGSANFDDYVEAVEWAQEYAFENRREMMRLILEAIRPLLPSFQMTKEAINCHHNYVQKEVHFGEEVFVTRKGAISAQKDEYGIIPGSMGAKSYIVKGRGNPDSFCSCSHGAGRRMSRAKAKILFNQQDLIAQTQGIECRKDKGVVDEIPSAYKDIDQVMENQKDLVEVVHTLKQVMCIKG